MFGIKLSNTIHELNTREVDLDILHVICHSWKCLE